MYDDILVPTDDSEVSRTAIEHAVYLAEKCDATLHGLFVTDSGTVEKIAGRYPRSVDDLEGIGQEALEYVESVATDHDVSVMTELVGGAAHEQITNFAQDNDIDVIVMGTHGRQGVDRYLLGSVTERVIRTADIPVLAVRGDK